MDPRFRRCRPDLTAVERVATGLNWAEGPVWFGDMRMLIFSNVQNNRLMKWTRKAASSACSADRG